jgi:signal peptidase I
MIQCFQGRDSGVDPVGIKVKACIVAVVLTLTSACSFMRHDIIVFQGASMLPTIQSGQRLKTVKLDSSSRSKLARGDIVAFRYPRDPSKSYIKRVIALQGETVEVQQGKILVNGISLSEPYLDPKFNLSEISHQSVMVPPHSYYVLGDNRDNSSDSRSWGVVPEALVFAKVLNP